MNVGIERLLQDLRDMGFEGVTSRTGGDGLQYAVIPAFEIEGGSFNGKSVDLGIPAPPDYPRSFGAAVHIKAQPHLVPFGATGARNVIQSTLGTEWQYWSYRFNPRLDNPTTELLSQINEIFRKN